MHLAKAINVCIMDSELMKMHGATVTPMELKRLVNAIVNPFDARAVFKRRTTNREKVGIKVGGSFAGYRKGKKIYINFILPKNQKTITLNTRRLNRLVFLTSQTLQHELIHKAQDKRYGPKFYTKNFLVTHSSQVQKSRKEDIKYYSTHEEVDCYAQNIAMELVYNHPSETRQSLFKNIETRNSQLYRRYRNIFKNTEWSELKKGLLKKVWKWLPIVVAPPKINTPLTNRA